MKIAIDIDSTLHDYWQLFARTVYQLHGIELDYGLQHTWHIPELQPQQITQCIELTHSDDYVLQAEPYSAAVETVTAWYNAGHYIQISSHRSVSAYSATQTWLEQIRLPFHELCCSYDKISHGLKTGIDLLIDDSPVNLQRAIDVGMHAATLIHPWNREICQQLPIQAAPSWSELDKLLTPLINANDMPVR